MGQRNVPLKITYEKILSSYFRKLYSRSLRKITFILKWSVFSNFSVRKCIPENYLVFRNLMSRGDYSRVRSVFNMKTRGTRYTVP